MELDIFPHSSGRPMVGLLRNVPRRWPSQETPWSISEPGPGYLPLHALVKTLEMEGFGLVSFPTEEDID